MKKYILYLLPLFFLLNIACNNDDAQPKPKAFLALNYDIQEYEILDIDCPYQFKINNQTQIKPSKNKRDCWINIEYPKQKATIYITYNSIDNNLKELLVDAQKLPMQHTIKADNIEASVFENHQKNTYGNFYEVAGDAASQAQFYVTDSVNHFLTGSIYFEARPNYDSVYPAAEYVKSDIKKIMETVEWKEE
ncbi:MAG: gliding motility lipoprotein GldD [Bacteroidota bacterium]